MHPAYGPPPGYAHAGPPPMHYYSGYPPPGHDPRMGPGGWPQPPGYGAHPQGGPPPAGHGHAPPLGSAFAGAAPPVQAPAGSNDFARDRPEQYAAFVKMAIHPTQDGGSEVRLPDGMCRDKHVPDFLECVSCWLGQHQGDPRASGRPWRIRCLDLSRNGLSDSSATNVVEHIQRLDLRVERLCLAGNGMEAKGLAKVTEYVWNCADALLELDISDNQVEADPTSGTTPGSDPVSALLRCLYNHPSYPQMLSQGLNVADKVIPLTLRLGGNRVKEPKKLLKGIQAKGGKSQVKFCSSAEPYDHVGKEFLSVCLPGFLQQNDHVSSKDRPRRKDRSRSGRADRRVRLTEAPHVKETDKQKKPGGAKLVARSALEEPEHWRPAASSDDAAEGGGKPVRAEKSKKPKAKRKEPVQDSSASRSASPGQQPPEAASAVADEAGAASAAAGARSALKLNDDEVKKLQQEVSDKLSTFAGLPSEESTRSMLAEFVVCMAVAGRGTKEIEAELNPFLAEEVPVFVKWFRKHTHKSKRPRPA